MHVEFTSDMDDEAKRDAINGAAAELQKLMTRCRLYSESSEENLYSHLAGQQQDSEAGDEVSAESAPGEPVHTSSQADS